jgi:glycosyltransferase involved in cell wall biosynthesis
MRVLFAIAHLDKGGGQAVQCDQLVQRLAPRVGGELLVLRSQSGVTDSASAQYASVVGDLRFPRGISEMRRAIRDRAPRYDLVQVFDPYYSLPAARLARVRPLVVRMGGHPVEDLASRYGPAARIALSLINPWLYSDTTVVVNARHLTEAFPRAGARYIPNGVDPTRFRETRAPDRARAAFGLPPGVPLMAFTGKIIPRKNVEDLYWLVNALPGLHLAMAGTDQEPHYGDAYHRSVRASFPGTLDRVHLVGELPVERVPEFLEGADLFAFPSRLEGMPNSILEAMAAGLPVVAADTPAHREILSDGSSFLYRSRPELLTAVQALVADPGRAVRMGAEGRRWVTTQFGFDAAVDAYVRLYEELLGPGPSGRTSSAAPT